MEAENNIEVNPGSCSAFLRKELKLKWWWSGGKKPKQMVRVMWVSTHIEAELLNKEEMYTMKPRYTVDGTKCSKNV